MVGLCSNLDSENVTLACIHTMEGACVAQCIGYMAEGRFHYCNNSVCSHYFIPVPTMVLPVYAYMSMCTHPVSLVYTWYYKYACLWVHIVIPCVHIAGNQWKYQQF